MAGPAIVSQEILTPRLTLAATMKHSAGVARFGRSISRQGNCIQPAPRHNWKNKQWAEYFYWGPTLGGLNKIAHRWITGNPEKLFLSLPRKSEDILNQGNQILMKEERMCFLLWNKFSTAGTQNLQFSFYPFACQAWFTRSASLQKISIREAFSNVRMTVWSTKASDQPPFCVIILFKVVIHHPTFLTDLYPPTHF